MENDKVGSENISLRSEVEMVLGSMPNYNEHMESFRLRSKDEIRTAV